MTSTDNARVRISRTQVFHENAKVLEQTLYYADNINSRKVGLHTYQGYKINKRAQQEKSLYLCMQRKGEPLVSNASLSYKTFKSTSAVENS